MSRLLLRLAAAGVLALAGAGLAAKESAGLIARGEQIYLHGRLGDGGLLQGRREEGHTPASGADAACVNCHRHSGLGSTEGLIHIPPITGRFLDPPRYERDGKPDLPFVENMRTDQRPPYTDETLARAIREGTDSRGRTLNALMPRYALDDSDMAAVIAYLRSLDRPHEPGVTGTELHFATIITPDADPVRRDAVLAVLQQYVRDKNDKAFLVGPTAPIRPSTRNLAVKSMFRVPRRWNLHVWQLTGAPGTWRKQLEDDFAHQPVLAVLSGAGGSNWQPVHDFCEANAVPCLFPNVDLPVDRPEDFYSLYFSGGVEVEAQLIAARLTAAPDHPRSVRQVYRAGTVGEGAAAVLASALAGRGMDVQSEIVGAGSGPYGLEAALRKVASADVLVLWLKPMDIALLGEAPARPRAVYLSGRMGGLEQMPLPASWRGKSLLAYPVDLPEQRRVRLDYALGWLSFRHIPTTDLAAQVDTWLACSLLTETLNDLVDAFIPEYLVERFQETLGHRLITGYYPRLSLAEHQRFASKGGYLVRFDGPTGSKIDPDGGWAVP